MSSTKYYKEATSRGKWMDMEDGVLLSIFDTVP